MLLKLVSGQANYCDLLHYVQMVSPLGGDSLTGYGSVGSQPESPVCIVSRV